MTLPFFTTNELKFYFYIILCGLGIDSKDILATEFKSDDAMSIADNMKIQNYIERNIDHLNATTNDRHLYLKNEFNTATNLGETSGQVVGDDFPLGAVKVSGILCKNVYLTCKVGDVFDGFTVVRVLELVSYVKFYYLYAFIGMHEEENGEITFAVCFRGTTNILQFIVDSTIAPHDSSISIKDQTVNIDYSTGLYKTIFNADNNVRQSAIDIIMTEITSLSIQHMDKPQHLIFTGHSLGAGQVNAFLLGFCSNEYQNKYPACNVAKFLSVNAITFGEFKGGRRHENRIVSEYIRNEFTNINYYLIINNTDCVPYLNSPALQLNFASKDGYFYQMNNKTLYKINTDTTNLGLFLTTVFYYFLNSLSMDLKSHILFWKIMFLECIYTIYQHFILSYVSALNSIRPVS